MAEERSSTSMRRASGIAMKDSNKYFGDEVSRQTGTMAFGADLKSHVFDAEDGVSGPEWMKNILEKGLFFRELPTHYPLRKKLRLFSEHTTAGAVYTIIQVLMSMTVAVFYVIETYKAAHHWSDWEDWIEVICMWGFTFDFFFELGAAEDRVAHWFTINPWIDLATVIPFFIDAFSVNDLSLNFIRVARLSRMLKIADAIESYFQVEPLTLNLAQLGIDVLVLLFIAAGVVQVVENKSALLSGAVDCKYINEATDWAPSCYEDAADDGSCDCADYDCFAKYDRWDDEYPVEVQCPVLTYYSSFWYMIVTASTVGYGDISPITNWGKFVVMCFIGLFLYIIPARVSQIGDLMSGTQRFLRHFRKQAGKRYLLVVGEMTPDGLSRMMNELSSLARGQTNGMEVVLMDSKEPSYELQQLLKTPLFDHAQYIMGSALSPADLARVSARDADAVFILVDEDCPNPEVEDTFAILTTLSFENCNSEIQTFAQVVQSKNKVLLNKDADFVLCVEDLRAAMLAKNLLAPGASTLLCNLFASYNVPLGPESSTWDWEYKRGINVELYTAKVPPKVWDYFKTANHLASSLYLTLSIVLLGFTNNIREASKSELLLNPARMNDGHKATYIYALLLCTDPTQAENLERLLGKEDFLEDLAGVLSSADGAAAGKLKRTPSGRGGDLLNLVSSLGARTPSNADLESRLLAALAARNPMGAAAGGEGGEEGGPGAIGVVVEATPSSSQGRKSRFGSLLGGRSRKRSKEGEEAKGDGGPGGEGGGGGRLAAAVRPTREEGLAAAAGTVLLPPNHELEFAGHLVVYGDLGSAFGVLDALRHADFEGTSLWRPVLVLVDKLMEEEDEQALRNGPKFDRVFFMMGTGQMNEDLKAARIQTAEAVLITNASAKHNIEYQGFELGLDGLNVMRYLRVAELMPPGMQNYCVELSYKDTVAVLDATVQRRAEAEAAAAAEAEAKGRGGGRARGLSLSFAKLAGRLPRTTAAPSPLRRTDSAGFMGRDGTYWQLEDEGNLPSLMDHSAEEFYRKQFYAAGKCFVPTLVDSLLVQAYYNFNAPKVCEEMLTGSPGCHFLLCHIPDDFFNEDSDSLTESARATVGNTTVFYDVFHKFLVSRKALAIGLLRAPTELNEAVTPYVYAVPDPVQTRVFRGDRVYVLGDPEFLHDCMEAPLFSSSSSSGGGGGGANGGGGGRDGNGNLV